MITVLEGSTFCICDERGDVTGETNGFFASDTRRLSRFMLTINDERPLLLSSGKVEYFSAAFYLRNPLAGGLAQDVLSIVRLRFVGASMQDRIAITNESMAPQRFWVQLELSTDFADIFAVKDHDVSLGNPLTARPLPPVTPAAWSDDGRAVAFDDGDDRTQVVLSRPSDRGRWEVELAPRERWEVVADVYPTADGLPHLVAQARFGDELSRVRDSLVAWQLSVPQIRATWEGLEHAFRQSVADLASLRMRAEGNLGKLPAAGMPWFMTVFGRDTIITCLQTLLFGPELAITALNVLADLQAREDDPAIDAEPGKIVHELRTGKAAKHWFGRYYGTVDATPLYLVLLSEVWQWTDDAQLVRALKEPALAALAWIDEWGDLEIAREVWRDRELAGRLEREVEELARRFDEQFWVDERGGFYALALDGDKRPVDSLTSNIGHLLWSGIVRPERADQIVDRLMGASLWSGWGVRTMSTDDAAYNPLSYHNGTVWPHDNSLVAWGLARYGRWSDCQRIARRMLEAAAHFEWQLPEVFAGLRRADTPFPIAYPTAARPQAWAAGTPVLLLQLLLGLEPDRRRQALETHAPPDLPSWVGDVRLSGVRAFGRLWDVRLRDGDVMVEPA